MKNLTKFILFISAIAMLSGCGGGDDGSSAITAQVDAQASAAQSVLTLLESDGSQWRLVKTFSNQANYAVYQSADGTFSAYNVSTYQAGMTKSQFLGAAITYSNLTHSIGTQSEYEEIGTTSGSGTACPSGVSDCTPSAYDSTGTATSYTWQATQYGYVNEPVDIYTDPSTGLVFEIGDQTSKDLESVSAAVENQATSAIRDTLVSTYGLSQDRAADLASLAESWKSIANSRTMTTKDLVEFQTKVFGTDMNTIAKAAKSAANGDSKSYDSLVEKAASINGVSPEQAKAILSGFVN